MSNQQTRPWAAKWGILISFVAVFALVFGLYLPGCSDNPVTSPDTLSQDDETSFFDQPLDDAQYAKLVDLAAETEEYLWGEDLFTALDGGSLVIGTNGNFHTFLIPAGALPYTTEIRVEIITVSKKDDVAVIYDFEPDGLVFLEPAFLIIDPAKLLGKKATCVDFYYLDESVSPAVWTLQGTYCADPRTKMATIPVYHFSKYGID